MNDGYAAEVAGEAGMEEALRAERVAAWKAQADQWLSDRLEGALFTADDLVAAIGLPDSGPGRNNVVGAWVNAQRKQGRIMFTGELSKSRRVEGHGNLQRLWRVLEGMEEAPAEVTPSQVGASSSPSGFKDPTQKAEATTTSEASEGGDDQADLEQTCDGGHGQDVAPMGSADGVRAEAAYAKQDGEGDPGSALNAGLADAPPGGPPEVAEQQSLLGELKAENPELWEAA